MSTYFKNFPLILYNFGDETTPSIFQNISAYVSIIDRLKDNVLYYTTEFIDDYERPDTLSFKLYNTIDYYWTFFYLNEDIRESGWPLSQLDLLEKAQKDYPNWTITTEDDITSRFLEGDTVEGLGSGSVGTVVKRYLDLGQIVIKGPDNYTAGELIQANGVISDRILVKSQIHQYNSVHHYENTSGEWIDIDPRDQNTTGLIPITYFDRIKAKNDSLRQIKVFKPEVVAQIQSEFIKLLQRGY